MKSYKLDLNISIFWIVTLAIAYAMGWWSGLTGAARVTTEAIHFSVPIVIGFIVFILMVLSIIVFRVRGYFMSNNPSDGAAT